MRTDEDSAMTHRSRYLMHDQVRDLVPDLMRFDARGSRRLRGSFTELLVFVLATGAYLLALGLSN